MFNMIEFAASQTPTTAPVAQLDFNTILVALGLAKQPAEEPAAVIESSMTIEFDSPFECEAFAVERNGVIVRFMRNQQVDCVVTDRRGNQRISARMTRVFFLNKDGGLIGETAVLPVVETQAVADALVWRASVMPEGDIVTLR
jgi:hypothetical protein